MKHFRSVYGKTVNFSCGYLLGYFIMPHNIYTWFHWHTDWRALLACWYAQSLICCFGLDGLIWTSHHSTIRVSWLWVCAELWSFCLHTFHNLSYKYGKRHVLRYAMACMWWHFPNYLKVMLSNLSVRSVTYHTSWPKASFICIKKPFNTGRGTETK
jgi:hypothetical protein